MERQWTFVFWPWIYEIYLYHEHEEHAIKKTLTLLSLVTCIEVVDFMISRYLVPTKYLIKDHSSIPTVTTKLTNVRLISSATSLLGLRPIMTPMTPITHPFFNSKTEAGLRSPKHRLNPLARKSPSTETFIRDGKEFQNPMGLEIPISMYAVPEQLPERVRALSSFLNGIHWHGRFSTTSWVYQSPQITPR